MPDLEPGSKLDIQISNVINEYDGLGESIEQWQPKQLLEQHDIFLRGTNQCPLS